MSFITFLFCVLIISALSSAVPKLQNITITVPEGTTNHGNPSLLCFPPKIWDIAVFFLGNYVAHVATMITKPGELLIESFFARLYTLFLPFHGILNGVRCIYLAACFQKSPLQIALKSSALCEVIRNYDWRPQDGDIIQNLKVSQEVEELLSKSFNPQTQCEKTLHTGKGKVEGQQFQPPILRAEIAFLHLECSTFKPNDKSNFYSRQVHGICELPKGYALTELPPQSGVELSPALGDNVSVINSPDKSPTSRTREVRWEISCSYSIIKPLIAIIQLFYGCLTLYRTRGDQVKQYGYSAFGLTVAPYVTMSFINLCGALLTPSYSHMYLVSTTIMKEAQKRTGNDIDGVVGTASVPKTSSSDEDGSFSGGFTGIFEVNNEAEVKLRLYRPTSHLQEIDCGTINDSESRHGIKNDILPQGFVVVEFPNEKNESKREDTPSLPILEIPSCPCAEPSRNEIFSSRIIGLIAIIIDCIPVAVVGGFSHFKPGNSLPSQRGWTMAWLTAGVGMVLFSFQQLWLMSTLIWRYKSFHIFLLLVTFGIIFVPGIGGFIVVGKMIREYGSCSLIS